MVFGEFGYEFTQTMMVGFITVYASLGVGGEVSVKFAVKGSTKGFEDFFKDLTVTIGPYVDVEGGVGVKGLLSIGLAMHGAMEVSLEPIHGTSHGDFGLDFFLRLRALFVFSKEIKLAGKHWPIGGLRGLEGDELGDWYYGADGSVPRSAAPPGILLEGSAAELVLEDKDYLAAGSAWTGSVPLDELASELPGRTLQTLKTNCLPGTEPRLCLFKGTEFLFWIDNVASRAPADMAALSYSYRKEDGSWTEPRLVNDDGTADYDFSVQEHRGKLYVAWQNTTKAFGTAGCSLEDMARHSHVVVAALDDPEASFGPYKWVNGVTEGFYYGRPRLASDGRVMALTYVENSVGDFYLRSGMSFIHQYVMKGDTWGPGLDFVYGTDKAFLGYDLGVDSGRPLVALCQDGDGNLATMDDRSVFLAWRDEGARHPGLERVSEAGFHANPRLARWNDKIALFYYEGDLGSGKGNIMYFPNAQSRGWPSGKGKVYKEGQGLGEEFSVVEGPKGAIGILTLDQGEGLRSAPAMTVYDPERGAWGLEARLVPIERQGSRRAEAPHGLWLENGRIDIAYRSLEASAGGPEGRPPRTDLALLSTVAAPDLSLDPTAIFRYYGPQRGGDLIEIELEVENKGLAVARGVGIELRRGSGPNGAGYYSIHRDVVLHPGEKALLPVRYRLPMSTEEPYNLYFVATHLSGGELDNGNNGAPMKFAEPDFGLGSLSLSRKGYERGLEIPIQNRSPVRIRDARLALYDDLDRSRVLKTFDIPYLEPYQEVVIRHSLRLDELSWPKAQKRLVFELTSRDVHKPGDHSAPLVLIDPLSLPAFTLGVMEARMSRQGYIRASVIAANNHPKPERGELVVEIIDTVDRVVASYSQVVSVQGGGSRVLSRGFRVPGLGPGYALRVSMRNTRQIEPGSPEAGDRQELGGPPLPVEHPIELSAYGEGR